MIWWAGVILLLVIAVVFDLGLLAYAMYVLLAVMLVSRFLTRRWTESLWAQRECNRTEVEIGQTVAVNVTLQNKGNLPIPWVLVEDLLPREALLYDPPRLRVAGRRVNLSLLRSRSRKSINYQLTPTRRGYYQIGPLVLETGDLFGLHRRYRVATEPHFLLVLPKVIPLAGYEVSSKRPIGEVRMSFRLYEDPTRISGVRAYEPGDPMNRVHWRATARTGMLHSKVYEPSTVAGATLLLEFHTAAHERKHEPHRSELAVTAAASIANAVYLMGQQVGLVTNGRDAADRIRQEGWAHDHRSRREAIAAASVKEKSDRLAPLVIETRRGPEQLVRILETLARVELTDGLPLPALIEETASRMPRDATVIAIMPGSSQESAIALSNLKRRGFAVTAILNLFETYDFADAAAPYLAEGIEVRHLRDEMSIVEICRSYALR
jgi:conserved repeat domain